MLFSLSKKMFKDSMALVRLLKSGLFGPHVFNSSLYKLTSDATMVNNKFYYKFLTVLPFIDQNVISFDSWDPSSNISAFLLEDGDILIYGDFENPTTCFDLTNDDNKPEKLATRDLNLKKIHIDYQSQSSFTIYGIDKSNNLWQLKKTGDNWDFKQLHNCDNVSKLYLLPDRSECTALKNKITILKNDELVLYDLTTSGSQVLYSNVLQCSLGYYFDFYVLTTQHEVVKIKVTRCGSQTKILFKSDDICRLSRGTEYDPYLLFSDGSIAYIKGDLFGIVTNEFVTLVDSYLGDNYASNIIKPLFLCRCFGNCFFQYTGGCMRDVKIITHESGDFPEFPDF